MSLTQSISFVKKMLTRQKIVDDQACSSIKQCETSEYIKEHETGVEKLKLKLGLLFVVYSEIGDFIIVTV